MNRFLGVFKTSTSTSASRALTGSTGTKPYILVTDNALNKLRMLDRPLRLRVDAGGCNGFQYRFLLEDKKADNDDLVFTKESPKASDRDKEETVLIDAISLEYLNGIELDYTNELIGESFKIATNPNASSECGCKISFEGKS
eukprot:Partr_v1_DN28319_c0_g1_i1_m78869 putative iron-sulfur cluster assembly 2 homolog